MDLKDSIDMVFQTLQKVGREDSFGKELVYLAQVKNVRELKPIDTAIRTKSEQYTKLNDCLERISKGGWL